MYCIDSRSLPQYHSGSHCPQRSEETEGDGGDMSSSAFDYTHCYSVVTLYNITVTANKISNMILSRLKARNDMSTRHAYAHAVV